MKIAVISDMHGNCIALDAVLGDLEKVDQIVCLGDAIQGGSQPREVVARLRELNCPVVMGNADDWLITGADSGAEKIPSERMRKMEAVREWSLSQLSNEDRAFIAAFQPAVTISLTNGRSLLGFHGSPASYDDVFLPSTPEDEFQKFLGSYPSHILTGGHTHLQYIRRLGNSFYFNPGSVGFAYSHAQSEENFKADDWAEYAVLTVEGERTALEFRKVPFDVQAVIKSYWESGRPFAEEVIRQYAP